MSIQITTAEGVVAKRSGCAECGACQIIAGGHAICRLNPPGRGPTGAALWPTVNIDTDWCAQRIP